MTAEYFYMLTCVLADLVYSFIDERAIETRSFIHYVLSSEYILSMKISERTRTLAKRQEY